ncbi:4'-phosphopantetheinyl transferase superfamily protein [Mycoplasma crocodyli]|uniref:Holo-[acyl-carrier-protein] synthase n=1 Tax=Mycoplasma crocodyli (strain ATCC 51981 / MP145) TaxID=512564 RepID=D5E5U8_MYCCM|nr:4'-phosphopantetheinyl transferase superfamily protein [Mycoplasma crocodyli]ADE19549.1 holo-[acyl-carrier-protein] synthase [Mycoplasma crocodyli MP145]
MVGIDLVKVSRFNNKTDEFVKKILSDYEQKIFKEVHPDKKPLFLARAWALKEAIFKADNSQADFSKIVVYKKDNKWCSNGFELSISHEGSLLIAIAIKKGKNEC